LSDNEFFETFSPLAEPPVLSIPRCKRTPITPRIEGYCVIIAQEENVDGTPGKFLGCHLQTPDSSDDGPALLLGEAIRRFKEMSGG